MSGTSKQQSLPWSKVAILSSIPLIMVLGNSMLIPVLTDMQKVLHVSKFQTSLVITLFSVPAGIIIPFTGFLSDRFGRKKVIIPSLFIYGVGGLIAGVAAAFIKHPYFIIMTGRVIQGLGAAGTAPITMALIGDLFNGAQRSKILGINEAANGLGKVVSPIIGSLFGFIVWYAAFFSFPILCVASALALWFLVKEPDKKNEPLPFGKYLNNVKKIFKREGIWLTSAYLCGVIALFTLFGVLFFLSEVLESQYHIDGILKGLILAIPLGAMCTTSYITGAVIKKNVILMKWLIVIGLFSLGGSLILNAFITNTYLRIGLLVISGIGTGLTLPCLNMLITSAVSTQERGMVTSLYGSVRFLGVAFGPPIFSWLMDISATIMFISVAVLAAVGGAVCIFFIRPTAKQDTNSQTKTQTQTLSQSSANSQEQKENEKSADASHPLHEEEKSRIDLLSSLKGRRVWTFRNKIR